MTLDKIAGRDYASLDMARFMGGTPGRGEA